jgi:hypothetical protein
MAGLGAELLAFGKVSSTAFAPQRPLPLDPDNSEGSWKAANCRSRRQWLQKASARLFGSSGPLPARGRALSILSFYGDRRSSMVEEHRFGGTLCAAQAA